MKKTESTKTKTYGLFYHIIIVGALIQKFLFKI